MAVAYRRIGVMGAGAWGTALANAAARAGRQSGQAGHEVVLWGRDAAAMAEMAQLRENRPDLPGIALDPAVTPTADLGAVAATDALLLVVPAQACRAALARLAPLARDGLPVISCAKGIERGTRAFMSEVIAEAMPGARPAVLSGPSFATDVAAGLPTAVTLAAHDEQLAAELAAALGSSTLRLYHSTDVRGAEIGGATKNVLAIAAGIVSGRRLGASAAAALVARGFAELMRFGRAYGAKAETITGLSGLGDLILTTSGPQSRNFAFGQALGAGAATGDKLAEGAFTASVLVEMARAKGVDVPVSAAVDGVLQGRLSIDGAIEALMARPQRAEG
ncbi:NAD(P)H-dependent glycerol-3-phosphate dehydrogenase [Xanthobacter oligotrophicus]|uniref:NAD(P)H-dependent glycerol-3-phosphate dehydrogenase n=1 Tax=Xanthobacter oligotrophicus TaxID=2607286 RepID=UPI0011F37530|nr:NAD(P)H-dependent glycerol-3-phosphate dehydrogenase [Xanthobacter oligotrophicus]MCG5237057.1 NAD(P)-dependent glycerol-3-phosphate dehydrogenase [Xanthobacter oligotrophicus]